ncbi:hypothetical protein ABPG75_003572 [Micractinium tetrahymenae]
MSATVDREALEHLAGATSWARLLPRDGDSTEEVQRKRRELIRVLRVQEARSEAARSRAQQRQQPGKAQVPPASVDPPGPTPPVHAAQQQQPSSGGWRTARRGSQGRQRQLRSAEKGGTNGAAAAPAAGGPGDVGAEGAAQPSAALPAPAAPAQAEAAAGVAGDEAGEEYHTPLGLRMPGPGRGTGRQRVTTGGSLPGGSGAQSALPSSSGIPTASTDSGPESVAAGPAGQQQPAPGRRRRRGAGAELAVGSGRLGLSAYLSTRGAAREAGTTPGPAAAPHQLASGGHSGGEEPSQQPAGRRWKAAQQQQEQQRNPMMRLLHRSAAASAGASQQQQTQAPPWLSQQALQDPPGGSFAQPTRLGPSRFAPDAAGSTAAAPAAAAQAALAPASLTTQIAASQGQELEWEQVFGGKRQRRQQAGEPTPSATAPGAPSPAEQQQEQRENLAHQQQQQRQEQQQQQAGQQPEQSPQGQAAEEQGAPASLAAAGGGMPRPRQRCPEQAAAGQAPVQLPRGGHTVGTALTFATGTGVLGPGATQWTLPPTPSVIKALSPDSPAITTASGRAAEQPAVGRQAGGSRRMQPGGGGGTGGEAAGGVPPPTAAPLPRSEPRLLASVAAGGTALALRRLPELSCAAETPQLLFASPAGQLLQVAQRPSADGEARQLFVAETPSDAAAVGTGSAGPDEGLQDQQQQQSQAAAAVAAALTQEAAAVPVAGPAAAAVAAAARGAGTTPAAATVARAAAAAVNITPAPAAASVIGLQLQLPMPVLQAVPCSDGLHVALLLGSYAPAGEPELVLVLRLPAEPAASLAAGAGTAGRASAARSGTAGGGGSGGSCCGVQVVAALAVERSKWGQGVQLTPNCVQLAATERAGLQLILSAALQLSEHPAASESQPAILVLSLSAFGSSGGGSGGMAAGGPAGGVPLGGRKRAAQQAVPGLLSIEFKEPLTCVALAGGNSLYASGDGPCVQRLDFDLLWRSYTWAQLSAASYRGILYEDVAQLQLYRDPEHPQRRLLLGLSSGGGLALWDADSSQLLEARMHPTYRLRSLQPVSMAQAGLTTPVLARVAAAGAAAAATELLERSAADGPHLFVGLVEHKVTRKQHVAAVMLCAGSLQVSSSGAVAPPPEPAPGRLTSAAVAAAQQQLQRQREVTAVAAPPGSRCCWLGTAAGELLAWDMRTGRAGGSGFAAAAAAEGPGGRGRVQACHSRDLVASACALPGGGEWGVVAGTAGGCCTLLART